MGRILSVLLRGMGICLGTLPCVLDMTVEIRAGLCSRWKRDGELMSGVIIGR